MAQKPLVPEAVPPLQNSGVEAGEVFFNRFYGRRTKAVKGGNMKVGLTTAQLNRLIELGASPAQLSEQFCDAGTCNRYFQKTEEALLRINREKLQTLVKDRRRPSLCSLEEALAAALRREGFLQVTTPVILSGKFLNRMTIDGSHPLNDQVFWLDKNSCLRPMLAPNLYDISKKLMPVIPLPLRVFEIGSCFRKESEGRSHLKEFTMLNLVEWGLKEEDRIDRLKELAKLVLDAAEITGFQMTEEDSVVYGRGLDVVDADGLELASTSMGLGFGLERLLMSREKANGIRRFSKSLSYLDGACLSMK